MRKHKVAPGVQKSLYPLEYNKNNPMEGFNEWTEYIRRQYLESLAPLSMYIIAVDCSKLQEVLESKAMNELIEEAKEIINPNNK
ncbi:hypothetical protein [Sphingobacterium sp. LRF_L2]|uniref:hypothetical protein n=1 Tax=Sphingobacterium sp. LRF_L2 TaxID=3369421 RepID=UPI003F63B097